MDLSSDFGIHLQKTQFISVDVGYTPTPDCEYFPRLSMRARGSHWRPRECIGGIMAPREKIEPENNLVDIGRGANNIC